jgi:hypothetical protein
MTLAARARVRRSPRGLCIVPALALLVLASGCGAAHKAGEAANAAGQAAQAAKAGQSAAAGSGSGTTAGQVTDDSVRIVNLFYAKGSPGPALDIYDAPPDPYANTAPTPLMSGVAFGTASDYAHPHLRGALNKVVELYALPAGADPRANAQQALPIGGFLDDGSHLQETILLDPATGDSMLSGPLAGLSFSTFIEKGDDGQGGKGPVAPPAPDGTAQLLASTQPVQQTVKGSSGYFLFVDDSCAPPLNGDPNEKGLPYAFAADGVAPVSNFAVFGTQPGQHHVTVVEHDGGITPTCKDLTPRQGAVDVTMTAGQQVLAFVYGPSNSDLHVVLAPIAP